VVQIFTPFITNISLVDYHYPSRTMNRMFHRFNIRKSRHRIEALGIRKGSPRNSEPLILRDTKASSSSKKSSRRLQLCKSFDLQCNTSETEETSITVPNVDSSASRISDTKEFAEANVLPDIYSSDQEDIPYVGSVCSAHDCEDDLDRSHRNDDSLDEIPLEIDCFNKCDADRRPHKHESIILLALQDSQKALEPFSSLDLEQKALSDVTYDKKHVDPIYVQLDQNGNGLVEQVEYEQAIEKYAKALYLKRQVLLVYQNGIDYTSERNLVTVLASIATSINNLAFLRHHQSHASAHETLEYYMTALQIKSEILGSDHLSVGKTLNNIGSIHYLQQDYHKAAETYEQARDVLQLRLGHDHLDVCTVTANLGDVHCGMKQWTRAVQEYRKALDLRWPLFGPSDPKVIRLMEQIAELEMFINQQNSQKEDAEDEKNRRDRFYGPIVKDVRKLQKEVQRDIDHLDILASQMPLEMIKDKITVFREIREMMNGDEKFQNDEISVFANQECSTVFQPNKKEEPEQNPFQSMKTTELTKQVDIVVVSDVLFKTPLTRSKLRYKRGAAPTSCTPNSSKSLTPEERQEALNSVKGKLAKLRAKKESFSTSQINTTTTVSNYNDVDNMPYATMISETN
jgi:tetratricopeptide (TPR) repeat protein